MGAVGILSDRSVRSAGFALALLLAAAVAAGCARKSGDSSGAADSTAARPAAGASTTRDPDDERPDALFGPAIGARDSLIETIRPDLAEWVALWRSAQPAFRVDSLRAGGWSAFRPAPDAMPWPFPGITHDAGGPESSPAMLRVAPGGRYALLIDRYLDVSTDGPPGADVGGEPDSAPVLLDRGTGVTSTFEFCGTSCVFQWGAWIDSTRFVLGGQAFTGLAGGGAYGTLGYYDLRARRKATWYVPASDSAALERYHRAWWEWLMRRYRAHDVAGGVAPPAVQLPALVGVRSGI